LFWGCSSAKIQTVIISFWFFRNDCDLIAAQYDNSYLLPWKDRASTPHGQSAYPTNTACPAFGLTEVGAANIPPHLDRESIFPIPI
jgi:hypothetical protein